MQSDESSAPTPGVGDLLRAGIAAARAGQPGRARELLSRVVEQDGDMVQAWLYLSGVADDPDEQRRCLQRVLALDPGNEAARRGLARLREHQAPDDAAPAQPASAAEPQPVPSPAALAPAAAATPEPVPEAAPPEPVLVAEPEPVPQPPPAEATSVSQPEPASNPHHAATMPAAGPAAGATARPVPIPNAPPAAPMVVAEPQPRSLRARGARGTGGARRIRNELIPIAALGLVLLILIALGVEGLPAPLPILRLFLGLAFVLFVPGYALQAALFPRRDALDGPERLALSFGLSVAVVAPMALILDYLPRGIRLWPIVVAEGLVIAVCSVVAWWRRRRMPEEERFAISVEIAPKGWWAAQERANRIVYGLLAIALLMAAIAAVSVVVLPTPAERFTEFYVLGPEGLAENYPYDAVAGQPVAVTAGIDNREGEAAEYRVEVRVGEQQIGGAGPVLLQDGDVWEQPVDYALPQAGDDQQVEFLLYRDGASEPYRSLRLWINVVEAQP